MWFGHINVSSDILFSVWVSYPVILKETWWWNNCVSYFANILWTLGCYSHFKSAFLNLVPSARITLQHLQFPLSMVNTVEMENLIVIIFKVWSVKVHTWSTIASPDLPNLLLQFCLPSCTNNQLNACLFSFRKCWFMKMEQRLTAALMNLTSDTTNSNMNRENWEVSQSWM